MNDNADSASPNGQPSLTDRVRELQLTNRLDGTKAAKGGSSATWLPWMLCILLALSWAGVGIRWYKGSGTAGGGTAAPSESSATKEKTANSTAQSKSAPVGEIVLESKGYLIPSHSIPISPIDVAGRVIELYIEEGKTFKKDQVLAVIDSTRYLADVKEAEAQVAASRARYLESEQSWDFEKKQADAELAEARAQAASAEIEHKTAKATLRDAVSKVDLNTLLKKWESAEEHVKVMVVKRNLTHGTPREQRIEAALRDLKAAEARLKKAVWSYENCTIKSPVTGIILTKKAEKDSLINPVVGGVSTSLCEIADLSQIEVDLEIQERDIARIQVGMTCKVRPDAYADRVYEGYVDRMMPIANRARGIIPVRVKVILPPDEPQGRYLKPEMGVAVTFINAPFPLHQKILPDFWRGIQDAAMPLVKPEAPETEPKK